MKTLTSFRLYNLDKTEIGYLKGSNSFGDENIVSGNLKTASIIVDCTESVDFIGVENNLYIGDTSGNKMSMFYGSGYEYTVDIPEEYRNINPIVFSDDCGNSIEVTNELAPPKETIQISCATEDAIVRYTTDNTDPSENSTLYKGNFEVSTPITIKAKGFKTGWIESDVISYEVEGVKKLPTPQCHIEQEGSKDLLDQHILL